MQYDNVLIIHMGGLGDMCLSESTFLSLSQHFQQNISALGSPRFFKLFSGYFNGIYSIESAKWLYLFSDYPSENRWRRIAFIGKDRQGELRTRWQKLSEEELIFIDMYPDGAFGDASEELRVLSSEVEDSQLKTRNLFTLRSSRAIATEDGKLKTALHIEDYQLKQLDQYGIKQTKKVIPSRPRNRVVLYPEVGITKSKWHHENFIDLYNALKKRGIEVYILESLGLNLTINDKISIEDLAAIQTFFKEGGVFVSNDSGMAHLAGMCGLLTITIFGDFDPAIWHPRGENISLRQGIDRVDVPSLKAKLIEFMDRYA